jgi:hypothetical protein
VHTEIPGGKVRVKLVDLLPLHPLLTDPATGQPLRAIGLSTDGLPMWPLLGADGNDDGGDDEEGSEDDEEDESEDDADDKGDGKDKKTPKKKTGPVSREEFDAVTRRLSAADKRRSEAEKQAAALQKEKDDKEREGKPELDNLKKDHGELVKSHESLQAKFKKLAMENAFHTASAQEKVSWHDPKVALRAADLDDLEIDEDGNVEGIRDAIKTLVKKHKYLVNGTKDEADEDDEEDKKTVRRGASGSGVGSTRTSKGKKDDGKMSDEDLRKRFPALKR